MRIVLLATVTDGTTTGHYVTRVRKDGLVMLLTAVTFINSAHESPITDRLGATDTGFMAATVNHVCLFVIPKSRTPLARGYGGMHDRCRAGIGEMHFHSHLSGCFCRQLFLNTATQHRSTSVRATDLFVLELSFVFCSAENCADVIHKLQMVGRFFTLKRQSVPSSYRLDWFSTLCKSCPI